MTNDRDNFVMAESIKTNFELDDLKDPELVWPCDHCGVAEWWPVCDDGATSSACNHCAFAIMNYIRTYDMN